MQELIKIRRVSVEDFKRIRESSCEPPESGLFLIGGDNRQGKTSHLDAIAAACGGEKFVPADAVRDGAKRGEVTVELSNGLTVRRTFTRAGGGQLTVSDPSGPKGSPQQLLAKFVSPFALDLSKWLQAPPATKLKLLLALVGVDFTDLDNRRADLYQRRTTAGQLADRAKGHFESLPYHEGVGEPKSAAELQQKLADCNAVVQRNAAHEAKVRVAASAAALAKRESEQADAAVLDLERRLARAKAEAMDKRAALLAAQRAHDELAAKPLEPAPDSAGILARLAELDEYNAKARANQERAKAQKTWQTHAEEYTELTHQIEAIDQEKMDTLAGANWPLKALSVEAGQVCYRGVPWENMAHSDQLIASTAICQRMQPSCGWVLIDGLESMDLTTLGQYAKWLESRGLQAIGTRVSKGAECSLVIQDGAPVGEG